MSNGVWRYTQFAAMSHHLRNVDGGFASVSDCNIDDSLGWFGDGSDDEREHLLGLKPCSECKRKALLP